MNDNLLDKMYEFEIDFACSKAKNEYLLSMPRKNSKQYYALFFFWLNKNKVVSKKQAEQFAREHFCINPGDWQALRHLGKQFGFDIKQSPHMHNGTELKKGEYLFVGFDTINFYYNDSKRKETTDLDFDTIKNNFDNCCASCGSKEGEKHRYTQTTTRLEKGHKDPLIEMSNDNIVPQCSYCNKKFANKFILDDRGQPKRATLDHAISVITNLDKADIEALLTDLIERI